MVEGGVDAGAVRKADDHVAAVPVTAVQEVLEAQDDHSVLALDSTHHVTRGPG